MKKNSTATAVFALLTVGAIAVPAVVWLLLKASQNGVVSTLLDKLK